MLLEPLGNGGMGTVALAISGEVGMETLCVVKRLLPHLRKDRELLSRFRDEANLARRLAHGNLVATHAVGQIDGEPFIAQEFVEGHDLADVRERCSIERIPFPADLGLYVVSQVARGLAYAHDFEGLGLVHRDINPVNIRLTYSGEVKLLDFGLALSKIRTVKTEAGNGWWGKLAYMAPEQIAEGSVDRRADVYVLGIVLWELLTRRPFGTRLENGEVVLPNETRQQLIDRVLRQAVVAPSAVNPDLPAAIDEIVLKALARSPEERFQTAGDLRAAIGKFRPAALNLEDALAKLMARLYTVEDERELRRELVVAASAARGASEVVAEPGDDNTHPAPPSVEGASDRPSASRTKRLLGRKGRARRFAVALALAVVALTTGALVAVRLRSRYDQVANGQPAQPPVVPNQAPLVTPEPPRAPVAGRPAAEGALSPTRPSPVPGQPELPLTMSHQHARRPPPSAPLHPNSPTLATASAATIMDAAETAYERKDFPEAIRLGRQAVAAGVGAHAHTLLGNAYYLSEKFPEAEKEYALALKLAPADTLLRSRLEATRERIQGGAEH
jgi:serine/threonine protein kinase